MNLRTEYDLIPCPEHILGDFLGMKVGIAGKGVTHKEKSSASSQIPLGNTI